jgi:hypothetical protein
MPAKATKAAKTGKAGKVTKASKTVKADEARQAGKRNVLRKTTNLPAHFVDNNQLSSVEKVSPKLDSLMAVELVQTAIAAIVCLMSSLSQCSLTILLQFFDIIWLRFEIIPPNLNITPHSYSFQESFPGP